MKPAGDIGEVVWETPTQILTINHGAGGGVSSSAFSSLAASYKDASGRILPNLLAAHGMHEDQFDKIAIAGFSAFHGLADPLLLSDGDRISAAVLLDACFTLKGGNGKAGVADFGARAADGTRLLVMTASNGENGPGLPPSDSGYECAKATFDRALALVGAQASAYSAPSSVPAPEHAERAGDFYLLHYGAPYLHGDLVNKMARDVLQTFLAPYLGGSEGPGSDPDDDSWKTKMLAVLGIAGFAALLGTLLARRS